MMEEWEKKLLERGRRIVKHGYGEVTMSASEMKGKDKIQVTIRAGESWRFEADKREEKS